MSSSSRNLSLVDTSAAGLDLAAQPLLSKQRSDNRDSVGAPEQPATIAGSWNDAVDSQLADFPAPKVRERVTFVSMRMPNSLLDQVEAICTERGVDRTALILHFVRQGLRTRVTQP